MKINFSEKQFEDLLKLVYLGNWMVNAHRTDDTVLEYKDLEQYLFSFCRDFNMERYIEYDEELKEYYPGPEFEESADIEQYKTEYDNNTFWDELIHRLARRDLIEEYGEDAVLSMSPEDLLEREHPFIEKYNREFSTNGLDTLEIGERGLPFYEVKGNA